MLRGLALTLVGCAAIALLGCSGAGMSSQKTCYPVKGQLFYAGKPAAGAKITFHPEGDGTPEEWISGYPRAVAQADGSFELETYAVKDGAPAGKYKVLVSYPLNAVPLNSPEHATEEGDGSDDRLQGRYLNPDMTPLSATVEAGPNELARMDIK